MKNLLIKFMTIVCCFSCIYASAQDIIVKQGGDIIRAKVLEINDNNVKYKNYSNLEGPTYTINIDNILSITYENGEKESFSNTNIVAKEEVITTPVKMQNNDDVSRTVLEAQIADLEARAKTIHTVGSIVTIVSSLGVMAGFVIATDGDSSFGNIMLGTGILLAVDIIGISITNALARPSENEAAALRKKLETDLSLRPTIMINNQDFHSAGLGLTMCMRF